MSGKTDDELVIGCQNGNEDCFNELVYRYKNMLYQYILAMVRDEGAAGDVFQEVFLSFYRHIGQYKPEGKLKSYLFTSARNRVLNYFRTQGKTISLDDTDEEGNAYLHEGMAGKERQPQEVLEQAELLEQIKQAAQSLSPRQREAIYLKQHMTFKEAADLLQRPMGTVLADYHRAMQKLQKMLG